MKDKYIRQIVKRLKCSKEKREDIKKQLSSDIMAAMENGETVEDIIRRMGTPAEIAEEFNRSFTDAEQKLYRREKWMKRLVIAAVIMIILAAAVYWILPKHMALTESTAFQEDEVKAQTEQIIYLLDAGDYEALGQKADEKLKPYLNAETMEKAKDSLRADWGAFQSFGNVYMGEVKQMGQRYVVVQMNAAYEHISVTYTLTFDEDMELSGLYMK